LGKKKGLDQAGRHRSGLSMGFPIRQAGRHHMAIQKKSSRMAEKEWVPEDLTEARANQKDFCSGKKRC